jgi:phosphoribosylamine--glycine ligase
MERAEQRQRPRGLAGVRILVVDPIGQALDWCLKCQLAGHNIRWFIRPHDGEPSPIGDGMVRKVDEWQSHAERWADLVVVTDNTTYLRELDALRTRGVPVFAASQPLAELELNRQRGQDFLAECGIDVLPAQEFRDYDKAIAYVKRTGRRLVSKPNAEDDKSLSYLAKNPADMVFMLERWKAIGKLKDSFLLQDFVPGTEVAVGGWITPRGFLDPVLENFEHKKLMSGDKGPNTGEMGTVARYSSFERSSLAQKLLKPLEERLAAMGAATYVDVAAIVDEDGTPWPLEFTCRFGWPTFNLQTSMHRGDPAEWMAVACVGGDALQVDPRICTGVLMAIPHFPYSKGLRKDVVGFPLYSLDEVEDLLPKSAHGFHPCEVMLGRAPVMEGDKVVERETLVSAGDYIGIATGLDDTVLESRKRAYKVLESIEMPSSPFYRDDIGLRLEKQLPLLKTHGFCKGWTYE